MTRVPFKRFLDLAADDIACDLHMHTSRTDGHESVDALLRQAAARGLRRVAFTEHVRRDTGWFAEFASDVRARAAHHASVRVLVGCEAKALDTTGGLDASADILRDCDIVLGSVHRFPDGAGGFISSSSLEKEAFATREHALAAGLVEGAPIDVLAHPGGMYARRFREDLPQSLMRDLMARATARGVAVEISSSYLNDMPAFLALCREVNPIVSIGSDVHRLDDLGTCRDRLAAQGVGRA